MPAFPLVDTNIFVRHILADHPEHSRRATAYLARIERSEIVVRTSDTVIFETVYTLERFYNVPRREIRAHVLPMLALPGIRLAAKRSYRRVFDRYMARPRLSFADYFHAVLVRRLRLPAIVSFDKGFDVLPDIVREEP